MTENNDRNAVTISVPWVNIALTLKREWRHLFMLNFCFVLFSIPVITIPATYSTCSFYIRKLFDGEKDDLFSIRMFAREFLSRFKYAIFATVAFLLVECLSLFGAYFYIALAKTHIIYIFFTSLSILTAVLAVTLFFSFISALALYKHLSLLDLLKVSVLAMVVRPLQILTGILLVSAFWVMHFFMYPVSLFLPMFVSCIIGTLILTLAVSQGLNMAFNLLTSKHVKKQ